MGPFRRSKGTPETTEASTDWKVGQPEYGRLGHALATVTVALESPRRGAHPPASARLKIRSDAGAVVLDPMMTSVESPRTKREVHRLWFVTELSRVLFGDAKFTLRLEGAEVELAEPVARSGWAAGDDDDAEAAAAALSESELRAALAVLEERCDAAERAAEDLRADGRRTAHAFATTLAQVQREREQLLALVQRNGAAPPADRTD